MQLGDADERLCRATGFAPSLFPLFQRALRDSQQGGELRLGQARLNACSRDRRAGFHAHPFAAATLDLAGAVDDLLPDIAAGFESGESFFSEFLSHLRTPPSAFSRYGPAHSPAGPSHTG